MIRHIIVLAMWAALPTPGQVGTAALYTEFEHSPAPAVVEALHNEVESLMAPDGLRFEWKSLPSDDRSVWMELAVVKFSGRCEVLPFAVNSQIDRRLGWTHVSDGVVLPFAEVDCDAIRAYVVKDLMGMPPKSRDRAFGRAVGRVMAHELLHIFARTTEHGSEGVDQPELSVEELLAERLDSGTGRPDVHILRANSAPESRQVAGSAQAGLASYRRNGCASCHGALGEGTKHGPALRVTGKVLNSVVLAAKLAKSSNKMCQRARNLNVAPPGLDEDELSDLVSFLNYHQ